MREMIKMIVVLTVLSILSGGLLSAVRNGTKDQIEYQQLKNVKGPAVKKILAGSSNDPLNSRFKLNHNGKELNFFVGVFDGKPTKVAFESFGKGFSSDVGVMVGFDVDTNKIVGASVTTQSETPGLGTRVKSNPKFTAQFSGLDTKTPAKLKKNGGQINAISGSTISSNAVCVAVDDTEKTYNDLKPKIMDKLKDFSK